jgi:predicted dehydrogenase
VLCEKPLALTPGDVDRVASAATGRNVVVAEAFMYRHHPLTAKALALVRDGAIGPLRAIRGTFTFVLTKPGDVRLVPEWGGGSLWDVGCYPVSYARLLVGAEPLVVTAQAVHHESGIDMATAATLLFPGGVLATIDCGFGAHFRTSVEVAGLDAVMTIEAPFKPGTEAELRLTRGDVRETVVVASQPLYLGEVEDLEAAALDGRPPRVSLADTRGNVAALAAIHAAARSGRAVAVADIA